MAQSYRDRLENLYYAFYKDKGDMERSNNYDKVIKNVPQLKELWDEFKMSIEEAHIIFEHRFNKLIARFPEETNK